MNKNSKNLFRFAITAVILFTSLAGAGGVLAEDASDPLEITAVDPVTTCGEGDHEVQFTIQWTDVSESYLFVMIFGDGDSSEIIVVEHPSQTIIHTYPDQGVYEWTVRVGETDPGILEDAMTGLLTLEGPAVVLSSSPYPPLFVDGDAGTVDFTTTVSGGVMDYTYVWDLDGDGSFDDGETGDTATFDYTEVGKYYPQVLVTDACGFTSSDTMPVVVADPEDACHPMAQIISDGVNSIFPDQSNDLYTCEDIYAIFDNESEENNLGFGLMWKAYHLAENMEVLTWEDILDWKLDQSGWGALLQLDRFADLLADHDLVELMGLVMSEEYTLGDVRVAVRSTTRFEADFEDALARIAEGANPGELGQFYKLANELEADPAELDGYLADGLTLSELRHAARFADRMEVDWTEIADNQSLADNWGDLKQAYSLAADGFSAIVILEMGVQEYKKSLQEEAMTVREEKQATQQEEKNQGTAERLAEQFTAEFGDVMNLFNGDCAGNWGCVRKALRVQEQEEGFSEKDTQTARQISVKYGPTVGEVEAQYIACQEDWACTRAHFRELYMDNRENGKPDKTGKPE